MKGGSAGDYWLAGKKDFAALGTGSMDMRRWASFLARYWAGDE